MLCKFRTSWMLTTTNQAVKATKADTLTTWRLPPVWPFIMNSRIDIGNTSTTTHTLFLWHTVRHLSEPPQNNLVKTHVGDIPCTLPHVLTHPQRGGGRNKGKAVHCLITVQDETKGEKRKKLWLLYVISKVSDPSSWGLLGLILLWG